MRFDLKKRIGEIGTFNNRLELHGDEKVKAIDLPMRCQVSPKELDMLVPTQGTPLSEFIYGPNLKKPKLQTFLLSPLPVQRKPEHIKLTIFDSDIDKRKSMLFEEVTVKGPTLEFEEDGVIWLSFKAQIHPGNLFVRIADNVEGKSRQFECKAAQPELFDEADEEDDSQLTIGDE